MLLTMLVGFLGLVGLLFFFVILFYLTTGGDDEGAKMLTSLCWWGLIFVFGAYQMGQNLRPWLVSILQ